MDGYLSHEISRAELVAWAGKTLPRTTNLLYGTWWLVQASRTATGLG
jgi:hypothetical protein